MISIIQPTPSVSHRAVWQRTLDTTDQRPGSVLGQVMRKEVVAMHASLFHSGVATSKAGDEERKDLTYSLVRPANGCTLSTSESPVS